MLRTYDPSSDRDALHRLYRLAFGSDGDSVDRWVGYAGGSRVRVVGDPVDGGLITIPMGMAWGGRVVPLHGVAGVAVAPESRGRRLATRMLTEQLRIMHDSGVALSGLYASTRTLYRGVGYGLAGVTFTHEVPTEHFQGDTALGVRPLLPHDEPRIHRLHEAMVPYRTGWLLRGPYIWYRVLHTRQGDRRDGWVVEEDGELTGWLVANLLPASDGFSTLEVRDVHAVTPAAWRRLAALLRAFGSMARTTTFVGGPTHPLFDRMPEYRHRTTLHEPWMLRVTHVRAALEARGYPRGTSGTVAFDLTDSAIPAQEGRWTLTVEDGRARVTSGGSGDVRVDACGLARLYAHHEPAASARAQGILDCRDADLPVLDTLFAGPRAVTPDPY